jgi:tetratricopeptide (TPR) repeat protein
MNKSVAIIVCLVFCFLAAAHPQQPVEKSDPTSEGVALYEQGDTEGAIKSLREATKKSSKDPRAWHYLGLALIRQGKSKEALQAFAKAIDLRTKVIDMEFSRNEEWRGDRLLNLKALLGGQIESQSKLLEILTEKQALEKGQLEVETSKIRAACVEQNSKLGVDGQAVLRKSDLEIQRPKILFKTEPAFPASAREASVSANVTLKAVFAPDRSVRYIETIRSSGDLFTEEAIKAANLTRFQPASICGKPISFSLQLEYSFTRF